MTTLQDLEMDDRTKEAKHYHEQELIINYATNFQYKIAFSSKVKELLWMAYPCCDVTKWG